VMIQISDYIAYELGVQVNMVQSMID